MGQVTGVGIISRHYMGYVTKGIKQLVRMAIWYAYSNDIAGMVCFINGVVRAPDG